MSHAELEARLAAAFPDSEIVLTDLAGDNDHWKARIVSPAFKGLPRVRQHQLVNKALADVLGGDAARPGARNRRPRRIGADGCAIVPSEPRTWRSRR